VLRGAEYASNLVVMGVDERSLEELTSGLGIAQVTEIVWSLIPGQNLPLKRPSVSRWTKGMKLSLSWAMSRGESACLL
jgi:hypothetical protein